MSSKNTTNKYYWIIGIIIILIIFGIILFIKRQGPRYKVYHNVPSNFLYQSRSDRIPDKFFIALNQKLDTDLIYQGDDWSYYCKPSGKKAKRIKYFSYSRGRNISGGWSSRYALICENNYWVFEGGDIGEAVYGPFKK